MAAPQWQCDECKSININVHSFTVNRRTLERTDLSGSWLQLSVTGVMMAILGLGLAYDIGAIAVPYILLLWLVFGGIFIATAISISKRTRYEYHCSNCGSSQASLQFVHEAGKTGSSPFAKTLTTRANRGYVVAASAALVGLVALFFPAIQDDFAGWDLGGWLELGCVLLVLAVSTILIFGEETKLAKRLIGTPIQYDRYGMIGGGLAILLIELLYLCSFLRGSQPGSVIISPGFAYWFFPLTAFAMVVGGLFARSIRSPLRAILAILFCAVIVVIIAFLELSSS